MMVYLDSSALVKRYVEEDGSTQVNELLAAHAPVASVAVTYVEISSALARAVREQKLVRNEAQRVFEVFENEWGKAIICINVQDHLLAQASKLVWRHHLRAYDAVHLASALWFQREIGETVLFATFDKTLGRAAKAEQVTVWP